MQFLDAAKGIAAYLIAAAVFLVTLEVRLKRRRAVKAVHELRAMAHIIDMHQLTKDPDRFGLTVGPVMVSGKVMSVEAMGRYLHYCTELLAILSKVGQLYVQDFPDGTALAAVDHCEDLTTGLSSKIWEKIMILDQIRADSGEAGSKETRRPKNLGKQRNNNGFPKSRIGGAACNSMVSGGGFDKITTGGGDNVITAAGNGSSDIHAGSGNQESG